MLTPEQLAHCADDIINLYAQLEEQIVRDIARRIAKTGTMTDTGIWQAQHMQELGTLHSDVLSSVAKYSDRTESELKKLFEDAGVTATEYDNEIYRQNGLNPKSLKVSDVQMQLLEAGFRKTQGNLSNLTLTTAVSSQTSFINACSLAELKASSGAFTPQQAIADAIKQVAQDGAYVIYPSGHRDRLDVAVRRNVMTGIGQTTGQICLSNAQELGCDLMEITAHAGARPSHAAWQGQIVSLSGQRGYLSLSDIGYGTGDGFKGWNCRHDWYPYFEGSSRMYSDKDLEELNAKNIEYPDGSMHTLYEAEQQQRTMERKLRETKRILAAQDECITNTDSESLRNAMQRDFDRYSVKLKNREDQLNIFCEKTGLLKDYSRSQKYGFGRSTAQKSVQRDKALYKDYKYYMGDKALSSSNFRKAYINGSKEYHLYRHVKEVNALYKVDFGSIEPYKIYELDQIALREKQKKFPRRYSQSGNFAILEYNGEYYFAHSQANKVDEIENKVFAGYQGDKSHLAITEEDSTKRHFHTFDVEQGTGKRYNDSSSDSLRTFTYEDTEAKLFESLESMWYNDNANIKQIYMLSERGMCDSCKYVAEQFMNKHPDIQVNVVSGIYNTGYSWKGRKLYD